MMMERITKDNFITDDKTNKFYISSLINKVTGDLDKVSRNKLLQEFKIFAGHPEALYNTMDVWARDYMPIQLTEDMFLSYTYQPDYLEEYSDCVTNWQIHNVHTQKQFANDSRWRFNVVQMPIILDGGNVVKAVINNKPYFIMCDKLLIENNINLEDFDKWWNRWWKENFDGTEMEYVLLPWDGHDYNPIGHADGMVRYISEGKVLMTNYKDFSEIDDDYHGGLMKMKLEEAGFEVEELSYLDKFDYQKNKLFCTLFEHSWSYINWLQVGTEILVPSLGYPELDAEALEQIRKAFRKSGKDYHISLTEADMTPIIAGNGTNNSGGALNCLTWTIKE